MKKNVFPLMIAATLLVGCGASNVSTYTSKVTDGDDTIISTKDVTISKDAVYHYLLKQYGTAEVLSLALTYIANQEITDTDAIKATVDEKVASFKENSTTTLEAYAQNYGYASEQEYIDGVLTDGVKQTMLKDKYIDKKYDSLLKEYKVKYLKVITVDTESGALAIIDEIKNGADFDSVMSANNGTDAGLVTTSTTTVDSKIIDSLSKFKKDGLYSKVITTSESKYAVIYVYNTDKSSLKDEIKTGLSSISDISTKMESYYLKKYNFDIYEEAIKNSINESNPDYLG